MNYNLNILKSSDLFQHFNVKLQQECKRQFPECVSSTDIKTCNFTTTPMAGSSRISLIFIGYPQNEKKKIYCLKLNSFLSRKVACEHERQQQQKIIILILVPVLPIFIHNIHSSCQNKLTYMFSGICAHSFLLQM